MLDLRRLAVFREIVARGSFSAAAEALNYSQSAVSHNIARLELELGGTLLERTRVGVSLTPFGAIVLADTEQLLDHAAATEHRIARSSASSPRALHVAAFASASATLVADAIAAIRHGATADVALVEADPADALAALHQGTVDAALVFDDALNPIDTVSAVDREHLLDDPMLLVLSQSHMLAGVQAVDIDDLADADWIEGAGNETPASLILHAACQQAGFRPRVVFNTGNFAVAQELVARGIGVALIPALALERQHPGVVARPLAPQSPVRRVHLLRRQGLGETGAPFFAALREAAHAYTRTE